MSVVTFFELCHRTRHNMPFRTWDTPSYILHKQRFSRNGHKGRREWHAMVENHQGQIKVSIVPRKFMTAPGCKQAMLCCYPLLIDERSPCLSRT
jgi:hypothetical protein